MAYPAPLPADRPTNTPRGAHRAGAARALHRLLAAALGALLLAALACGPGASAPQPSAPAAPPSGPAPAPPAASGGAPAAPPASATAPTTPPAPDRIKVGYSATSYAFLSMFLAHDQGFYARHGIEAELVQSVAQVGIAGMINGDIDFSMAVGSFARAGARGLPIRVLEESGRAPQLYLIARPDVRGMADLRGKIISPISIGGTNSQTLTLLLRKHGVDPTTVQLLPGGDTPRQMEMLRQRQIDAALMSPPFPLLAQREGFNLLANAQEEVELSFTGLTATLDTINNRADLTRRIIRAEIETLQHLHADRAATIQVMQQRFATEPALASEAYDLIVGAFNRDGSVNRSGMENLLMLDKEEGAIPDHVQFEDVVELRPLQDVQRAMGLAR